MRIPTVYIASSFKHIHGVRLLGRELRGYGFAILDWTEKATPPMGLTPAERRQWMDTDIEGGQVFSFCRDACLQADIVVYFGAAGQDAGVEVGIACGAGVPVLGIRGPLEAPGLMLHGAITVWAESVEGALALLHKAAVHAAHACRDLPAESNAHVRALCTRFVPAQGANR
ncbi:MAG: translation initiation factor 2 [Desulfovibrionaceae bacterium]